MKLSLALILLTFAPGVTAAQEASRRTVAPRPIEAPLEAPLEAPSEAPSDTTKAQAEPSRGPVAGDDAGDDAERERWERLSEEERAVLRKRFQELKNLSPEERTALEERHRGVEQMRARVRERLSPEVRRELQALEPDRRRELMREELFDEARGRGARIRESLPPELERELEAAPPEQRPRILEDYRRSHLDDKARRRAARLAKRLGLSEAERERIAGLDQRELHHELARLEQASVLLQYDELGSPPEGVEAGEWARLRSLPPGPFLDELMRRGVIEGPPRPPGSQGGRERPPEGLPGRPPGPPPGARDSGTRSGAGEGAETQVGESLETAPRRRVRELLHLGVEERLEFADLSRGERAERVAERVSRRALEYLETEGLLSPTDAARLRGLPAPERVRALRELGRRPGVERRGGSPPPPEAEGPGRRYERDASGAGEGQRGRTERGAPKEPGARPGADRPPPPGERPGAGRGRSQERPPGDAPRRAKGNQKGSDREAGRPRDAQRGKPAGRGRGGAQLR